MIERRRRSTKAILTKRHTLWKGGRRHSQSQPASSSKTPLQQNRGIVDGRPVAAGSTQAKLISAIERIDKHVDRTNRIALINEIIEAFGQ